MPVQKAFRRRNSEVTAVGVEMTVMITVTTIGCRLQSFAGCRGLEIGCTHGRHKDKRFCAVSFMQGKLIHM